MERKFRTSRWANAGIILAILMLSTSIFAHELTGIVEMNGMRVAFVAVDILGSRKLFARTNEQGEFRVNLSTGSYVIRIRHSGRREHFRIYVSKNMTQTFQLPAS